MISNFPECLGPFGVSQLPSSAYPRWNSGTEAPPASAERWTCMGKHGWYSVDTLFSSDIVTIRVRKDIDGEPSMKFDGVQIASVKADCVEVVDFDNSVAGPPALVVSGLEQGTPKGAPLRATSEPRQSPRTEPPDAKSRKFSLRRSPTAGHVEPNQPSEPGSPGKVGSPPRASIKAGQRLSQFSPKMRSNTKPDVFSGQVFAQIATNADGVKPWKDDLDEMLLGAIVRSINNQMINTPQELQEHLETAGPYFTMEVQDEATTPLFPFHLAGLPGIGLTSPRGPVTIPPADRRAALIPESATEYCMAYPVGCLASDEDLARQFNLNDPVAAFAVLGGFMYLDANGEVVGANALAQGEMLHFDGPFPWRQEYTDILRENGRLIPITLGEWRRSGAEEFAYLLPGETLSRDGLPSWTLTKHGGFVFLGKSGRRSRNSLFSGSPKIPGLNLSPAVNAVPHSPQLASPRTFFGSNRGAENREHTEFHDCFYVMLGGDQRYLEDDWERLRICPHCGAQQLEERRQDEVEGAMRCENCGQISDLESKSTTDSENLFRKIGTLIAYLAVLIVYVVFGAFAMQELELPNERRVNARVHRGYSNVVSTYTDQITKIIENGPDGNITRSDITTLLARFTLDLQVEDDFFTCTPPTESNTKSWENIYDAMFICFTMVITIPDVLPRTTGGRVFFVFYLIGGLVCVLNVIFDIARVVPNILREALILFRSRSGVRKGTGNAMQQQAIQKRAADAFDLVDWDSSGALSREEFLEYLAEYEAGEPLNDVLVQSLLEKLGPENEEMKREDVQKATILWEKMKEEADQVPGGYLVAGSLLGNIGWIMLCAYLYRNAEGIRFDEGLWLCFLTLTTVGFDKFFPQNTSGQIVTYGCFLVGLGLMAWMMEAMGGKGKQKLKRAFSQVLIFLNCKAKVKQKVWIHALPPVRFFAPNDEHGLFCPFHPATIDIGGDVWPSVLHFVTYERFRDTRFGKRLQQGDMLRSLDGMTKALSTAVPPREGWEEQRDDVMLTAFFHRISQDKEMRDMLLSTGERMLIFDISECTIEMINALEFKHWGTGKDIKGKNRLGELLQMIRLDLKTGRQTDLRPGVCQATPICFYGYDNPQYAIFTPSFPISFTGREKPPLKWPTVDHFFQAKKFKSFEQQEKIRQARTHYEALEFGRDRSQPIQDNWDYERQFVMFEAQLLKFAQNPRARQVLLQTGTRDLLFTDESNGFWGTGTQTGRGTGENVIGSMLMALRENLKVGTAPRQILRDLDERKVLWARHRRNPSVPLTLTGNVGAKDTRKPSRLAGLSRKGLGSMRNTVNAAVARQHSQELAPGLMNSKPNSETTANKPPVAAELELRQITPSPPPIPGAVPGQARQTPREESPSPSTITQPALADVPAEDSIHVADGEDDADREVAGVNDK